MPTSSSSSSQGSTPGLLEMRHPTPGDLIINSLENLEKYDFKRFKNKLSDFSYGDKASIPKGRLENADWTTTKDLLIDTYGEEGALDVTTKVLTLIDLMGPANVLQGRRAQNDREKKTIHNNRLADFRKEYRESVKEKFQRMKEYNSHMGEAVNLQERYTKLLMRKGRQNKEDKEQKIRCSGRTHLQITEKGSSDESSSTTIQALFDPDKNGFLPKIVVLQGAAGIGKTMTSKKILLDWASENLYQDMFDFVFYLSCREINTITGNTNLVGLLSSTCRLPCADDLVSILKDPKSQRRLLILVDGFDELRWTLETDAEECHDSQVYSDVSEKTHKEIILQRLLRKQVLQQSSVIITTRSLALDKLNTFIDDARCVEILGFTREDCEEYVHNFFENREDADKVLSIIKDNDIVYTMCAVPVTCWIVCTVMKQEVRKDLSFIQCHTMTSIYLLYLEVLLTHHIKKDQPGHRTPEVIKTCLKKLCALANDGVLHQQILFGEGDLKRHRLSLSEVESVFLNENIFHQEVRAQTCYSFIHLSVQEFLAALYYALDYSVIKGFFLPEICKGKSLSDLCSDNSHLALAVQFLFGLLNEKLVKTFSESTGINISLRARSAMKRWAMKDIKRNISTHTLFCLYETQDEDFIRSVMSSCSDLRLRGSHTGHLWMDSNYSKQLTYCLATLKTKSFQSLHFIDLPVDSECQEKLSPLLHRCKEVGFDRCRLPRRSDEDDLRENKVEDDAESSEDTMYPADLSYNAESSSEDTMYPSDLSYNAESSSEDTMYPADLSYKAESSSEDKMRAADLSFNAQSSLEDTMYSADLSFNVESSSEDTMYPADLSYNAESSSEDTMYPADVSFNAESSSEDTMYPADLSYNAKSSSEDTMYPADLSYKAQSSSEDTMYPADLSYKAESSSEDTMYPADLPYKAQSSSEDTMYPADLSYKAESSSEDTMYPADLSYNAESSSEDTMYPADLSYKAESSSEETMYLSDLSYKAESSSEDTMYPADLSFNAESSSEDTMYLDDLSFLINAESKIQVLWLQHCGLTSSCFDDLHSVLITNRSLITLNLWYINLPDSGIKRLCEGLRDPRCILQKLWLNDCGLTSSCCDHLHSVLITNRSLIILDLWNNNLQDSGIKRLGEGLRDPRCVLRGLRIYHCKATLLCVDDLCSVITTNQSLIELGITLDVDKKMSNSELDRYRDILRHAGFSVWRWFRPWMISFERS